MIADQLHSLLSPSNPVFARAHEGKRIPNALVMVVVFFLLFIVAFGGSAIAVKLATGDSDQVDRMMDGMFGLFVPFGLLTLLVLLWARFFEKRSPATLGLIRARAFLSYIRGFALGLLFMGAVVGVMAAGGGVTVQTDGTQPTGYAALGTVLILVLAFVVQGGTEEVITRGWFMQVLGARYRPWIGVVVSSVLFSALHAATQPVAIINLLLFGLFMSFYYLREGSLWGICGWHSAWNWSMMHGLGLTVSGQEPTDGVLFDLQTTGNPLWTGGAYGPEASLITTVVLLAGIAYIVMIHRMRAESSVSSGVAAGELNQLPDK
jgi:membrane protease YdiL (CAAX protease family)